MTNIVEVTVGDSTMEVSIEDLSNISPGVAKVFKTEQDVQEVRVKFEDQATMPFTKPET